MDGYAGKILRVDLTTGTMTDIDSSKYLPEWVGGIGLGYRILWEETNENTTEWSPENTLIFAGGPANGSPVPTAGRVEVVGLAPYGYPIPWAAESGAGGDWSTKIKWAGYDAVVVTGKSEEWKYVYIDNDGPQLLDATELLGMGTYTTQQRLEVLYGKDIAALCIGQAGENKLRLAVIQTNSENTMGQGGFGAVMGDKKIKAICVKPGNHKITWADPEGVLAVTKKLSYELGPVTPNHEISHNNTPIFQDFGSYTGRRLACAYSNCQANDHDDLYWAYNKVPAQLNTGSFSGTCGCSGGGGLTGVMNTSGFDRTNIRLETHYMSEGYGINNWGGVYRNLIVDAYKEGLIDTLCGLPLDETGKLSPADGITFWRMVVNRETDEAFAWGDGGQYAAVALGLESVAWKSFKHGYGNHWDGRNQGPRFPMWVGAALDWAVWGRDPFNDAHGWPERVPWYVKEWGGKGRDLEGKDMVGRDAIPYADLCVAAAKLYGTTGVYQGNNCPDALAGYPGLPDDSLGYKDLEYAMYWHNHNEWFKNSMVMCDCVLPLLFSSESPDLIGYHTAEMEAFNACTGANWTIPECHESMEKAFCVMRAIHVRQGRTREHDESVIRFFTDIPSREVPEGFPEEEHYLKRDKFIALLERYYELRGWDVATGWPTRAKLESLGLKDVADDLARIGKLPS
ncbi:aldehyde ferredoxin oxidoreductase N-terminal domain-containing protein [Chloroflexota bacterium]